MNLSTFARRAGLLACLMLVALVMVAAVPMLAHAATAATQGAAHAPHMLGPVGLVGLALGTSAVVQSEQRRMAGNDGATASPFVGILPPDLLARTKSFYVAPLDVLALAAGGNGTGSFVADTNHDYVFYYGTYRARAVADGAVVANPPILADVSQNGGVEYNPNDKPVDIDNLLGTATQPSVWGIPIIVMAGQTLNVRLTSAAAVALNVRMALVGFRCARVSR